MEPKVRKGPSFFGDRSPEEIKRLMDAYMKGKGDHIGPISYPGGLYRGK